MEIEEITEWMKNPEKIINPVIADELLFFVSSFLTDFEESLAEVDQQVAVKRLELIEKYGSVAKGEVYLEIEDIYLQQQTIERRIRQLKAFKNNVRRRYEILSNRALSKY